MLSPSALWCVLPAPASERPSRRGSVLRTTILVAIGRVLWNSTAWSTHCSTSLVTTHGKLSCWHGVLRTNCSPWLWVFLLGLLAVFEVEILSAISRNLVSLSRTFVSSYLVGFDVIAAFLMCSSNCPSARLFTTVPTRLGMVTVFIVFLVHLGCRGSA